MQKVPFAGISDIAVNTGSTSISRIAGITGIAGNSLACVSIASF